MKKLSVNEVRELFLKFFEAKEHSRLQSFSVVPHNDKSLLLINSGMAPMKAFFTGQETPPSKRVVTCQKCIRTGDIENVGKTARHGTFFEMLGNFSFGDYFKKEIIPWSWEFVIDCLELDAEKLFVSVYQDDDETYNIWKNDVGIPEDHLVRLGKADNFWEHGLGPCGPCTEIYYDRGEAFGCGSADCAVGCDCDRYMEFWNLVLTQYNKNEDGSYSDLEYSNVDTGMGLERMAAILQEVDSIFDVDTIKKIINKVCEIAKVSYGKDKKTDVSIRVITDHIRSVTVMTADGVLPSNEGRGYVLRRLLRRAARHGRLLGIQGEFLAELSKTAIANSCDAYPELLDKKDYILKILAVEENSFYKTIDKGMEILKTDIEEMKEKAEKTLSGEKAFRLYDTYGFPVDLTKEILEEEGFDVEEGAFESEMKQQRERARAARGESSYMGADETVYHQLALELSTVYAGYDVSEIHNARIIGLIADNEIGTQAVAGSQVSVLLDKTPFYAESGGQVGDRGSIKTETGVVLVRDCIKVIAGKIVHVGEVTEGSIAIGDTAFAAINLESRMAAARNHTATHLLQKALRTVLGTHVEQAGSYVGTERMRFDFTHFTAMTDDELEKVELMVNDEILAGLNIDICETSIEEARSKGAMALFGEKYGNIVRVVSMGDFSIELCGGVHLNNTAQAGSFKIVSENGVAAGVRRIEALTGKAALSYYHMQEERLKQAAHIVKAAPDSLLKRLEALIVEQKENSKEIEKLKAKMAGGTVDELLSKKVDIGGINVLCAQIPNTDANTLKTMGDQLKAKLGSGVIVLLSGLDGKVSLLAMATEDAVTKGVHAGNIIKGAAAIVQGGGGGRPNMAQAGGKDATKIPEALEKAMELIKNQLQA